tara:strand:- start:1541 stop:1912 length:372 start_codon:yes stop_codon:yes gene_type:complete
MHNNNRRRNFRGRQQKNNFRRRTPSNHGINGHFSNGAGNNNYNRNGSSSNPLSIEKVIFKFQQLAKDAQSSGDPVLIENYLQHAEHYARKLAEINLKSQPTVDKPAKNVDQDLASDTLKDKKI